MLPVVLAFSFLSGSLLAYIAFTPARDGAMLKRLRDVRRYGPTAVGVPTSVEEEELALPFAQRVLQPVFESLLRRTAGFMPRELQERARVRLLQAGVQMDPARFVGLQATVAGGGALVALVLTLPAWTSGNWASTILLAAIFMAAAWRLPNLWLVRLIAARKKGLEKALADVLDLLSVSVEAGLGFDGAVQKVADKFPEPVSGEFREYLKEVRLGRPRAQALRNLADRSAVPDLQTFAAAIIQADQLGVSMANVLKAQSDAMRTRRKQRAEERAMQLPLKMLFPLIFFILPTLFIVVLGPVVIQFMTTFQQQ